MSVRILSHREKVRLDKLLVEFRRMGDEIVRFRDLREALAAEIAPLLCPFIVGDQVYVQRPSQAFHEPHGICEVVEVFAIPKSGDFANYSSRPNYEFRVRQVLKSGGLGKRLYSAHLPKSWRRVAEPKLSLKTKRRIKR